MQDENLAFLARELWDLGVAVGRVIIVPDDIGEIARGVRELADTYDWVLTTGGIGPTHDDVTIDGVAAAFGVNVVTDPRLEERIRSHCGAETTPAHLRMARAPEGATVEGGENGHWPTIRMGKVFVFPGVPVILRRKFRHLRELFRQGSFYRESRRFRAEEVELAPILESVVRTHSRVRVGSYPQADHVLITLEGSDRQAVEAATASLDELSAVLGGQP